MDKKFNIVSRFIWKPMTGIRFRNNPQYINKYMYKGSRFYISSYGCPMCNENLYKVNTIGRFLIDTDADYVIPKSIFTCSHCRILFASNPNYVLSDSVGVAIGPLNDESYIDIIDDIERIGVVG